jgi:hypothetical protein
MKWVMKLAKFLGKEELIRVVKEVESEAINRTTLLRLGQMARNIIYRRVKTGSGVDQLNSPSPNKVPLKPLSRSYIEFRRKIGVRGRFGSPSKSNLTFTGQMLDSMDVLANQSGFVIRIPRTRREGGQTNADVARHVQDNGREFFNLTASERKILEKDFFNHVRRIVQRKFGRS